MSAAIPITLLQQREIEARIVGPLFHAFAAEIGEERAKKILLEVVQRLARESGCRAAEAAGGNSMAHLQHAVEVWQKGNALTLEIIRIDDQAFEFNVTRCKFAELYRELGLSDLGFVLSCSRDGAMVEGFNPNMSLDRPKTLMMGHDHCDFRFRMN